METHRGKVQPSLICEPNLGESTTRGILATNFPPPSAALDNLLKLPSSPTQGILATIFPPPSAALDNLLKLPSSPTQGILATIFPPPSAALDNLLKLPSSPRSAKFSKPPRSPLSVRPLLLLAAVYALVSHCAGRQIRSLPRDDVPYFDYDEPLLRGLGSSLNQRRPEQDDIEIEGSEAEMAPDFVQNFDTRVMGIYKPLWADSVHSLGLFGSADRPAKNSSLRGDNSVTGPPPPLDKGNERKSHRTNMPSSPINVPLHKSYYVPGARTFAFDSDELGDRATSLHCFICNATDASTGNVVDCNMRRGRLSVCGRGFNVCLQYCDANQGVTVRTCGRSHRRRNDVNCRTLRDAIPSLAHCSECHQSSCNQGMNCQQDLPFHGYSSSQAEVPSQQQQQRPNGQSRFQFKKYRLHESNLTTESFDPNWRTPTGRATDSQPPGVDNQSTGGDEGSARQFEGGPESIVATQGTLERGSFLEDATLPQLAVVLQPSAFADLLNREDTLRSESTTVFGNETNTQSLYADYEEYNEKANQAIKNAHEYVYNRVSVVRATGWRVTASLCLIAVEKQLGWDFK